MKIGIYTALKEEAHSFIKGDYTVEQIGAYTFYKFDLAGNQAVLCLPPYVGEITAAAGVQLLITHFGVEVLFNFGVVGALTERASSYAMTYVGRVCHYAMDTSAVDGCEVGYYDVLGSKFAENDSALIAKAKTVLDLPVVTCASADKFVADPAEKADIARRFEAEICDMESAAIAIVCRYNNLPCLMVKCVADTLFGGAEDYTTKMQTILYDFRTVAEQICK